MPKVCDIIKKAKKAKPLQAFLILTELIGRFRYCDGFAHLSYAESACHSLSKTCEPIGRGNWCCHFHLGLLSDEEDYPEHWDHCKYFCAQGSTPEIAISRAIKLLLKE
jgi:hypothetical protein